MRPSVAGGMGKAAASVKEEDFVEHLLVASSHDTLLCFTSSGKVFLDKGLPDAAGQQDFKRQTVEHSSRGRGEYLLACCQSGSTRKANLSLWPPLVVPLKTPLENFRVSAVPV